MLLQAISTARFLFIGGLLLSIIGSASGQVDRIIDGDTFETNDGEKVRLIGINAPETSDVFGPEATQHLANLISGKQIELVADRQGDGRDRYGRLLRYVFVGDMDVNYRMIADGYATAYLKFSFTQADKYRSAQEYAMQQKVGMWGGQREGTQEQQTATGGVSIKFYVLGSLVLLLLLVLLWNAFRK
jgi:endonuclease YncB( thermonuclease family)